MIAFDTVTIEQPLAKDGLRFGMTTTSGAGKPIRRAIGRAGQHGVDGIHHRSIGCGGLGKCCHQYRIPSVRIAARPGASDA